MNSAKQRLRDSRAVLVVRRMPGTVLLQDALDGVHALDERLHPRPVRDAHEIWFTVSIVPVVSPPRPNCNHKRRRRRGRLTMTRTVKQIPPLCGIEIEEDARHDNRLLLETRLEEVEAVVDLLRQLLEVQPEVEGAVRLEGVLEAHLLQPADDVVALVAEVPLQRGHLGLDALRLQHRDRGLLEGHVAAAVEVGAARADGLDELFGAEDPGYAPAGEAEALCEAVDDDDIVVVDVDDVVGGGDHSAVAVCRVVVALMESGQFGQVLEDWYGKV